MIVAGFLMLSVVRYIPFDKVEEGLPAVVILIKVPLTYSIARGISFGFITAVVLLIAKREWRALNPSLISLALLFAASFALDA